MFSRFFSHRNTRLLGVDIGTRTIKVILLSQRRGHYKVEAIAIEPVPEKAFIDSDLIAVDAVPSLLRQLHERLGLKGLSVVVALATGQVICKVLLMEPSLTDDELHWLVKQDVSELISAASDEVYFDFESMGLEPQSGKLRLLVTAARARSVKTKVQSLEVAGFKVNVVDVENFALMRALTLCRAQLPEAGLCAIVNVNLQSALCCLSDSGELVYSKDVQFANAQSPQGDVCSFNHARELLLQVRRALSQRQTDSAAEALRFVLVSGDRTDLAELQTLLQQELQVPVVLAEPFEKMSWVDESTKRQYHLLGANFLMACGLALRSFQSCHR